MENGQNEIWGQVVKINMVKMESGRNEKSSKLKNGEKW